MATDAYLQIDGIKGESADSAHQGWIELSSAHWGVMQPRSATASTAVGHTTRHSEHRTLSLTKLVGIASPGNPPISLAGARVGMVPKQTFSLWNRYDFTPALGAGLGVICRDAMFASTSNAVTLPGTTRIDGALFYRVNAQLDLQLNVENLFDRRYEAYANGDNNITPGSPRAVRLGVHGNF